MKEKIIPVCEGDHSICLTCNAVVKRTATLAERERCIREVDEALEFASAVSGKGKGMGSVIKILTDLKNNIVNSSRPPTIPGGRRVKAINRTN